MQPKIRNQKAIIDRKALLPQLQALTEAHSPDKLRAPMLTFFKDILRKGSEEVRKRCEGGSRGRSVVQAQSYLIDQIMRMLFDVTVEYVYRRPNPTKAEQISLVAVGGYGRGEMAPQSDVDILFLLPYKQTPWGEQVAEYMLYMLWDMGLKVGHSTRSVDECISQAKADLTIRTAMLEARYIWGDQNLFMDLRTRFDKDVVEGTGPEFVEAKLEERDQRHQRMGDTRYVVEPNLKEGKGGLRDLHTLYWISKYVYKVHSVSEVVALGVLTPEEYKQFKKAENFLWTVRCHLHYLTGRPEERITFDVQTVLAERLGYRDHAGTSGVERFMKHYFLTAKTVGDLTRIFCAYLEDQHKRQPRFRLPRLGMRNRTIDGFAVEGSRINFVDEDDVLNEPVRLISIFKVAQDNDLDIHPQAMRVIHQNLKLVNSKLRRNPEANRLFLDIMTHQKAPDISLRLMNEAGVFGRFIPDFGRVVAQMQHDMYHVYTVDEHTIRAIGLLSQVEQGTLAEDHPLANEIIHKVLSRQVLYVAVLLHDIAKGRGGDHSVLGEEVAYKLCPRLGLSEAQTETVAWLVRWHLLMSNYAFKRDLNDPKTVEDFVKAVQSPERLRLLLVLTVVDIRAVGPNIWNGWKGQLLRDLYYAAEEVLLGGQAEASNQRRVSAAKKDLRESLSHWSDQKFDQYANRFYDSYWTSLKLEEHARNALMVDSAEGDESKLAVDFHVDNFQNITEMSVYALDHPGLFARITGALAVDGVSIQDARIFTTKDGMALDTFWIQDFNDTAVNKDAKLAKLRRTITDTLLGKIIPRDVLANKKPMNKRAQVFKVAPLVLIDNKASNKHTVIEINGRDRPGLLFDLSQRMVDLNLSITSAHVATYGERAVTVFSVKDLFGHKITHPEKLQIVHDSLIEAIPERKSRKSKSSNTVEVYSI
ncbi:MAG: [protein-PII] uridylyltransferase [Kordiimonas sp.]|nr:[protein-PII] uridylyltransferase [Kordiimonas sp.]